MRTLLAGRRVFLAFLAFLAAGPALAVDDLTPLSDEMNDAATLFQWQRVHAVERWNADQLETLDINTTRAGRMVMMPFTSTWFNEYRGELTFKYVTGDFVITTDVEASQRNGAGAPRSLYSLAGIMIRTPRDITPQTWTPGGENYVFLSLGAANTPGTFQYEVKTTINSVSTLIVTPGVNRATIQVARIGRALIMLRRNAGANWVVHRRYARNDMPVTLQAGLTTYTDYQTCATFNPLAHNQTVIHSGNPDLFAAFDYVRYQRPVIPPALLGRDFSNAAEVTDAQLLSFLGDNANTPPRLRRRAVGKMVLLKGV